MCRCRETQLRRALFRGGSLHPGNVEYLAAVRTFTTELLSSDLGRGDLTANALGLKDEHSSARVLAKAPGVAAGIAEFSWLLSQGGLSVHARKQDGERVERGEALLEIDGARRDLLAYERVGLNILQRMSGIATMTRNLQDRISARNPAASVVGTRKTPWGLLDKRAIHLGGGGTHRLGLWDAILVKNNHLALLASREEEAVCIAVKRAWLHRGDAAFLEIEVRSQDSALAAARTFQALCNELDNGLDNEERESGREEEPPCPCLLMLDNIAPEKVRRIVDALRSENLLEHVLLEASGNISESNLEAYADSGVDAISVGSLTHSARALDLSQALS
jgi:nicotinate-nucleotide pyrophosphorylase (carboxylating)